MVPPGQVPAALAVALKKEIGDVLGVKSVAEIDLWAVHPGGKSVLDAVERSLDLAPDALETSRGVLRDNGNMSSATVMFVLERMLAGKAHDQIGCAMAFGPGLTAETMMFRTSRN
jgi:predicted naringenin-chalcone synthase